MRPIASSPTPSTSSCSRSGKTSFLGMTLRRPAPHGAGHRGDRPAPGFEFPNAAREADRIVAIALADSTGFTHVLSGAEMSTRRRCSRECTRLIRERDPDVIEGHNIFRFDLEYLEARARRHRVAAGLGPRRRRAARLPRPACRWPSGASRYRRYGVAGRHIVDTWMLAQLYDVGARDLPSFGLKDMARHFGVAAPERTYLAARRTSRAIFPRSPTGSWPMPATTCWRRWRCRRILSPPYFVQAQALPFDYQSVVLRGNATKIDALLLREYLHRGHAVPAPGRAVGVGGRLYGGVPSGRGAGRPARRRHLALSLADAGQGSLPASDALGVFGIAARRPARVPGHGQAAGPRGGRARGAARSSDALQQTFKILINSFYGYLGLLAGALERLRRGQPGDRRGPPARHCAASTGSTRWAPP